jgi:Alpha/beta hydrolase domain
VSRSVTRGRISRGLVALVAAALLTTGLTAVLSAGSVATASAASPTVAPLTGGAGKPAPANLNALDLGSVGYQESEVSLSGTASAYSSTAPLTADGKWTVTPSSTAPYKTRAVTYRPIDPKKFNGTVIVEWLNVSGGLDGNPDWTLSHNELIREGFAWVGVSAQAVGVNQLQCPAAPPLPATCLTTGDPARYGSLSHPGDSYSYDMFSQAGQAVRDNPALMLGGLTPKKIIAAGESQSAFRLLTYINAVQPLVHVYDGFLVHSAWANPAKLSQTPLTNVTPPVGTMIRNDVPVPVFEFETETDVVFANAADRQPDTNRFRLWEVAGGAHFDWYGLVIGPTDTGNGQGAVANLAAMQNPSNIVPGGLPPCAAPINTGGTHWVLDAAVYWLNLWVVHGIAPPTAPYLQLTSTSPVVFTKDANGNTLGGVRSPQVDVPVATLGGVGNTPAFCSLFGTTVPYPAAQLSALYPNHLAFSLRYTFATVAAVAKGTLLLPDAVELIKAATSSQIGN